VTGKFLSGGREAYSLREWEGGNQGRRGKILALIHTARAAQREEKKLSIVGQFQ